MKGAINCSGQFVIRPVSHVHPESPYGYSHLRRHEDGPKQETLDPLRDTMVKLDINMELV